MTRREADKIIEIWSRLTAAPTRPRIGGAGFAAGYYGEHVRWAASEPGRLVDRAEQEKKTGDAA